MGLLQGIYNYFYPQVPVTPEETPGGNIHNFSVYSGRPEEAFYVICREGNIIDLKNFFTWFPDFDLKKAYGMLLIYQGDENLDDMYRVILEKPHFAPNELIPVMGGIPLLNFFILLTRPNLVTELLRNPKIDPNIVWDGRSPLHMAVMEQNTEIIKALLERRDIDIDILDREGRKPDELALLCPDPVKRAKMVDLIRGFRSALPFKRPNYFSGRV